jgi:hypothetical protein
VIVTRGLGLPAEGNLAVAGFGLVPSATPPGPAPPSGTRFVRLLLPDERRNPAELDDDVAIALALLLA